MKKKVKWKNIAISLGILFVLGFLTGITVYTSAKHNTDSSKKSSQQSSVQTTASVSSESSAQPAAQPAVLTEFLRTALEPKDQVLYVWGGGWNEEDTAGNEDTSRIGLAPSWLTFFQQEAEGYNADEHRFEIHNGLDCSGYIGWVLYNTLPVKQDYVTFSHSYGELLSGLGYGEVRPASEVTEILPGDIMSTESGHVYIALGQFEDGSVLLLHSSPPGVKMSGTPGIAYETALLYQNNGWNPLVDESYLFYDQFRFNEATMSDPDHLREMSTAQVVDFLYGDPNGSNSEHYLSQEPDDSLYDEEDDVYAYEGYGYEYDEDIPEDYDVEDLE